MARSISLGKSTLSWNPAFYVTKNIRAGAKHKILTHDSHHPPDSRLKTDDNSQVADWKP